MNYYVKKRYPPGDSSRGLLIPQLYTNNIYNVEINKRLLNMSDWVGFERFSVGLVHGRLGQLEYLNPLQTCEKKPACPQTSQSWIFILT